MGKVEQVEGGGEKVSPHETRRRRKCRNVVAWNWHSTKVTASKQKWPTRSCVWVRYEKMAAQLCGKLGEKLTAMGERRAGKRENWTTGKRMELPHVRRVQMNSVAAPKDMHTSSVVAQDLRLQVCHKKYCNHKLGKRKTPKQNNMLHSKTDTYLDQFCHISHEQPDC